MPSNYANGSVSHGSVISAAPASEQVRGPAWTVYLEPSDSGFDFHVDGRPTPRQLLRTLGPERLMGKGERVVAELAATGGRDTYVYTGDLEHRIRFTRHWHRRGRSAAWYGINPIRHETDGDPSRDKRRTSLRNVVGVLDNGGRLSTLHVMNLVTKRTDSTAELSGYDGPRHADPTDEREVLASCDEVLLAWGGEATNHLAQITELGRVLRELNIVPTVRADKDGVVRSTGPKAGLPQQPWHARMGGYKGWTTVPAPDGWDHRGLPATSGTSHGVQTRKATAEDLRRFGIDPSEVNTDD